MCFNVPIKNKFNCCIPMYSGCTPISRVFLAFHYAVNEIYQTTNYEIIIPLQIVIVDYVKHIFVFQFYICLHMYHTVENLSVINKSFINLHNNKILNIYFCRGCSEIFELDWNELTPTFWCIEFYFFDSFNFL